MFVIVTLHKDLQVFDILTIVVLFKMGRGKGRGNKKRNRIIKMFKFIKLTPPSKFLDRLAVLPPVRVPRNSFSRELFHQCKTKNWPIASIHGKNSVRQLWLLKMQTHAKNCAEKEQSKPLHATFTNLCRV